MKSAHQLDSHGLKVVSECCYKRVPAASDAQFCLSGIHNAAHTAHSRRNAAQGMGVVLGRSAVAAEQVFGKTTVAAEALGEEVNRQLQVASDNIAQQTEVSQQSLQVCSGQPFLPLALCTMHNPDHETGWHLSLYMAVVVSYRCCLSQ